jgi:CHASE3 domain sensor protein
VKALPEKNVAAGFGLAILLLCGVSIASCLRLQKLVKNKQWVIHTYEVIGTIDTASEAINEAENARRGYLITQQKVDLDTYYKSVKKAARSIEQTRRLTIDNPTQQQRLEQLEPLVEKKLALLDRSVDLLQRLPRLLLQNKVEPFSKRLSRAYKLSKLKNMPCCKSE